MTDLLSDFVLYNSIKQKKVIFDTISDLEKSKKGSFEVYKYFLNIFPSSLFFDNKSKESQDITKLQDSVSFIIQDVLRNIRITLKRINSDTGQKIELKYKNKVFMVDFDKIKKEFDIIDTEKSLYETVNQPSVKVSSEKFLEYLDDNDDLIYAIQNKYIIDKNIDKKNFYNQYHQLIIDKLKKLGFDNPTSEAVEYLCCLIEYIIKTNKELKIGGFYNSIYNTIFYNIPQKESDLKRLHIIYHEFCHLLQSNYKNKAEIDESDLFQVEPQAEMFGPICMILENYKLLVKRYNLNELNKELEEENKKEEGRDEEKIRKLELKIEEIKLKIREKLIRIISNYDYRLFIFNTLDIENLQYNPTLFNNIFMKVIDDVVNSNGKIILDDGSEQEAISSDGIINFRIIYEYTAKRALEHYDFLNKLIEKGSFFFEGILLTEQKKLKEGSLGFINVLNYIDYFYEEYDSYVKGPESLYLINFLKSIERCLEELIFIDFIEDQAIQVILELQDDIENFLKNKKYKKNKDKFLEIINNFYTLVIVFNIKGLINVGKYKRQLTHNKIDLFKLYNYLFGNTDINDLNRSIILDQYLYNKYVVMPKLIQEIEGLSGQEKLEKQKELLRINSINQRFIYQYNLKLSTFKRDIDAIDLRIQELEKVKGIEGNLKAQAEISTLKQRKLDKLGLIIQGYKERKKIIEELKSKGNYILGLSEEEKIKFDTELKAKLERELDAKIGRLNEKIKNLKTTKEDEGKKEEIEKETQLDLEEKGKHTKLLKEKREKDSQTNIATLE